MGRDALQHAFRALGRPGACRAEGIDAQSGQARLLRSPQRVAAAVGTVTSGALSPTLGYPIALAYLDAALAEPGTVVKVDIRGRSEQFEVTPTPFYRRK